MKLSTFYGWTLLRLMKKLRYFTFKMNFAQKMISLIDLFILDPLFDLASYIITAVFEQKSLSIWLFSAK